ncbi:MAG: hypothetical protein V4572_04915 [Bacteroidota bacterium]
MKKTLTLTILLLLLHNLNAQTIHDTIFNNVLLIQKENVTTNGYDFLIDIPIKVQKTQIIIFNDDERIPVKLFFERKSFMYEQNEILLITKDREYYKSIRESERETGYHLRPVRQNKFYYIQRNGNNTKVDSISVRTDDPFKPIILNFKNPELKKNEVKYYYQECYGSSCCPRDANWNFKKEGDLQKNNFNNKYKVNIYKSVYRGVLGKEGEHCDYFTLNDLSNEQKIDFMLLPPASSLINLKNKDIVKFPFIILPSVINTINPNLQKVP